MNCGNSPVAPIGIIHSCYTEKFGIPKQPGMVKAAEAWLELYAPCNREEMVRGLEQFSHLWILFIFHQTVEEGWKATVRPPYLGGRARVGVFASRSPHRPNHLGMSAVRLEGIDIRGGSVGLKLAGIDLMDGTPVVDIKPYIPYSDRIDEASCGYTREPALNTPVYFTEQAERFCREYRQEKGRDLHELVKQTLRCDPRPASQRKIDKEFGILLWDINIRWRYTGDGFEVQSCKKNEPK